VREARKVALITGGADGLGAGAGRRLFKDGWVIVLFDRNPSVLETANEISSSPDRNGGLVIGRIGDVTSEKDLSQIFETIEDDFGRLDLVVANAGIAGVIEDLAVTSTEAFQQMISVNLFGVFITCQMASRKMIEAKSGCIITTSSIFGVEPVRGASVYCASKSAVIALGKSLALELAPYGIRVNSIAPGYMRTEMQWQMIRDRAHASGLSFDEERLKIVEHLPLGRHGEPDDFAGAVAFLASDDAAYITGNTLGITGGVVLW
jgi:NAD(P)-dependent dehydrogenase (short-subunit alcohol dehydrogenase family)